ncbi:MAG: 30S ribosomal protein S16 [Bryobacterales bacterium]
MLAIRLARVGAKKQAAYRVVVMEKSRARDSRSVEILGHYNPRQNPTAIELKQERVDYWLSKGAQPSDRVSRLIKVYKERPADFAAAEAAKVADAKKAPPRKVTPKAEPKAAAEQPVAEAKAAEPEAAPAAAAATETGSAEAAPAEAAPAEEPASGDESKSAS